MSEMTGEERAQFKAWRDEFIGLRYVYHYRSLDGPGVDRLYEIAMGARMHFSRIDELNDPFEGQILPTAKCPPGRIRDALRDRGLGERDIEVLLSQGEGELTKVAEQAHRNSARLATVACFSRTAASIQMWSYYANAHRGVCLRFRTDLLTDLLGKWTNADPVKVVYDKTYPEVSVLDGPLSLAVARMFGTKAHGWDHEEEWRVVLGGGQTSAQINPEILDGIIMGHRISVADEVRVRDLNARLDDRLELMRARPVERRFELAIVPA
jgi:hypothetical protein